MVTLVQQLLIIQQQPVWNKTPSHPLQKSAYSLELVPPGIRIFDDFQEKL